MVDHARVRLAYTAMLLGAAACSDEDCQLADEVECSGSLVARIAVKDSATGKREAVTLDGRGSVSAEGVRLSFTWALSPPVGSATALSSTTDATVTMTPDVSGVYGVMLIVSDGSRTSEPGKAVVEVVNTPPVAVAGADQSVPFGATVSLDGSSSEDADGDPLRYQWTISTEPVGNTQQLAESGEGRASFTPGARGRYSLRLAVSDGEAISTDTMALVVGISENAPVADAGSAVRVAVGDTVALDGSRSTDADADTLDFSWTLVDAPMGSTATIARSSAVRAELIPDVAGGYVVELVVSDGFNVSRPAQIVVTAIARPDPSGCVGGSRTGFMDAAVYPDIAGCGPPSDYPTSVALRESVCAGGFHPCGVDDPRVLALAGLPPPADTRVWLPYDRVECRIGDEVYDQPDCVGAPVQTAALVGTGGCSGSGACGQGYRPILWTLSWDWSARLPEGNICIAHLNHACGYPGGMVEAVHASVACCRDP